MSDLAATNCGSNGCNRCSGNNSCSIIIWILLLSTFCGGGNGISFANSGCGCGCDDGGNQSCIWIILILLFCGCGNGGGFGGFGGCGSCGSCGCNF